jgi:hypothetical protein
VSDFTDYLAAKSADELAELLAHATGFAFEPDLPDLLPELRHNWTVRLDASADMWVLRWAYSSRCWSKRRGDWLTCAEMEYPWHPSAPWWDEVHFRFAESMQAMPVVYAEQARRAAEAEAVRRSLRPAPAVGAWGRDG